QRFVIGHSVAIGRDPDYYPANSAVLADDVLLAGDVALGKAMFLVLVDVELDDRRRLAAVDDELSLDRSPTLGRGRSSQRRKRGDHKQVPKHYFPPLGANRYLFTSRLAIVGRFINTSRAASACSRAGAIRKCGLGVSPLGKFCGMSDG